MPMAAGSPMWTGAPWALGNRALAVTAFESSAAGIGRMETTSGPWKAPAGRKGAEGHHRGPVEGAGGRAGDRRPPHRDVLAVLDVPEPDPRLQQRPLERERAAQEEGDEVIAPVRRGVGDLVGEHAVLVDPVARQVGAEVRARRHAHRLRRADVGDFQQRARSWITLAEEQEVVGSVPGEHREVRLDVTLAEAGGDARQLAPPDVGADLAGGARVDRHTGVLLPDSA